MNLNFKKRVENFLSKLFYFCNNNWALLAIFLISTFLFLYQHFLVLSWDFSAYVINAKYFFYSGNYLEVLRPPLVPLFLGIFLVFGKLGEYLYIIFVSILFLYSIIKLSDYLYEKYFNKYPIKKTEARFLLFLLISNPFLIYFGLIEGSELLGLSFFILFITFLLSEKPSGYFLSLAILTRYNYLAFLPLIFINKDYKKILLNLFLFILILSPWFFYNYVSFGNPLTSMVDSYNNNIILRAGISYPIKILDFLLAFNFLLPFFIMGLFYSLKKAFKKEALLYTATFFYIFLFTIFDYCSTPFKIPRYLFNLSLPLAYFSVIFLLDLTKIISKKKIFSVLVLIWLLGISYVAFYEYSHRESDDMYSRAANVIIRNNLSNCSIRSNHWVSVNYYTGNVYSLWMSPNEAADNSEFVLLFKGYSDYSPKNYPVLFEDSDFILFSKYNITQINCKPKFSYSSPDTPSSCEVISKRFEKLGIYPFLRKICLIFNKQ